MSFYDEEHDIVEMILTRMKKQEDDIPPNLRYLDRSKVKAVTQKVNQIVQVCLSLLLLLLLLLLFYCYFH